MKLQIREVKVIDLLVYALLYPAVLLAIWLLAVNYGELIPLPPVVVYILAAVLSYIPLKKWIIGMVLCYKAFAPLSVRRRCRFVPTCSTYMIMAINKYGLFVGVAKGIGRILRCKPPNGGTDYP